VRHSRRIRSPSCCVVSGTGMLALRTFGKTDSTLRFTAFSFSLADTVTIRHFLSVVYCTKASQGRTRDHWCSSIIDHPRCHTSSRCHYLVLYPLYRTVISTSTADETLITRNKNSKVAMTWPEFTGSGPIKRAKEKMCLRMSCLSVLGFASCHDSFVLLSGTLRFSSWLYA
jgi:hypothetical protein